MNPEETQNKHADEITHGPLPASSVHICVDMQNLFARETDWHTPWMPRVLPKVRAILERHAEQTIFTRFVPVEHVGEGWGTWRAYYERWASMTIDRLGWEMVDLVPELAEFVPPARVVDKKTYSPWLGPELERLLRERKAEAVVVTGGETDVCVLATVLGAVDRGYRVIVVTDALCSSSDETHDALLKLYQNRYGQQVETARTETLLSSWP